MGGGRRHREAGLVLKAVIEADRNVDQSGIAVLGNARVKTGYELANQRVTLRLDGHLMHVVHEGVLAKTLPAPVDAEQLRGARVTFGETRRRVKVIGRFPGESSCVSLVWAVLDRAARGWRGFTTTPAALRTLHDLHRALLEPPTPLRPATTTIDSDRRRRIRSTHGIRVEIIYTTPRTRPCW